MAVKNLTTVGEIARQLRKPIHRIDYIIKTRRVQPVGRAGNAHVFAESDVAFIEAELRRIDDDRRGAAL